MNEIVDHGFIIFWILPPNSMVCDAVNYITIMNTIIY